MNITELFQDMTGTWRARVDIGTESIYLKFERDKKPDDTRILVKAQNFIDNRNADLVRMAAQEVKRLQLIADVQAFDETTITKNDAITLVKKLIKNYYHGPTD